MKRRWVLLSMTLVAGLVVLAAVLMPRNTGYTPGPVPRMILPQQTPQAAFAIVSGFGAKTPIPLPTNHPLWAAGRNAPIGAECNYYLGYNYNNSYPAGSPVWENAPLPTGCAAANCTSLNINWSYIDDCLSSASNTYIILGDGSQIKQPMSIAIPPYFLDAGDGDGSNSNPWQREYVPQWMADRGYLFKFQYDNGDGNTADDTYWGIRYDGAFKDYLIRMIQEAGERYADNDQVVAVRVGVGFQAETQPVKRQELGNKLPQLLAAHEAAGVTCAEYRDFVTDLVEAALTAFPNKVVTFNGGPAPCSAVYSTGETYRERQYTWTTDGNPGWEISGTPAAISLHWVQPDRADAEAWSTRTPRNAGMGFLTAGNTIDGYGNPVIFEYGDNPSAGATGGSATDPWQYHYWNALSAAGHGGDYVMPFSTWAGYYTNEFWDTVLYRLGDTGKRAWVVLRDAEFPEYSWNAGAYGRSGSRPDFGGHLALLTPTVYPQACSSSVKATATAAYKVASDGGNTMGYNPCPNVLPTPKATYQATPIADANGETNMRQRLWNRQARQISTSAKLALAVDTSWQYYADTADVTMSVDYLDVGTDDVSVKIAKPSGASDTHTIDKVNSGLWKRETWTVSGALVSNALSVAGIGSAFIELTNGASTVLNLHEVFFDVGTVSVQATNTPTVTPTATATFTPTPTFTATATRTPTPTSTPVYPTGVRFNEVNSAEGGDWNLSGDVNRADRYFELINWSNTTTNIGGWQVDGSYGGVYFLYTIPANTTIRPYEHKVFLAEDIGRLPDSGIIFLWDREENYQDSVNYAQPTPGLCYATNPDASTNWTNNRPCSPGQPNP